MQGVMSLKYFTNIKVYHKVSNFPSSDGKITEIRKNLMQKFYFYWVASIQAAENSLL